MIELNKTCTDAILKALSTVMKKIEEIKYLPNNACLCLFYPNNVARLP